jgi:hypothetical protein
MRRQGDVIRGVAVFIARRARLLQEEEHLSLWEQHPVRDWLVYPKPHRAQGVATTGTLTGALPHGRRNQAELLCFYENSSE